MNTSSEPQLPGVYHNGGRWGRRRLRVDECFAVLTAGEVYERVSVALADRGKRLYDGWRHSAPWTIKGRAHDLTSAYVRLRGSKAARFFFVCGVCDRLVERLYVPTERSRLACRQCFGLTYRSRALRVPK